MAQDLTRLVVDSLNENNLPRKRRPNKKLSTEKVFLPIDDVKADELADRQKLPSDFAMMNYCGAEWSTRSSRIGSQYYLRSASIDRDQFCTQVDQDGFVHRVNGAYSHIGIAPMINLGVDRFLNARNTLPNGGQIDEVKKASGKGYNHVLKIGEYPQTRVSDELNDTLEGLFNSGKLQEGLSATGRWFTTNGSKDTFQSRQNPEFIYNGEKYVRVNPRVSDKTLWYVERRHIKRNTAQWVKVEPVTFKIKNWDRLPKSINPKGKGKDSVLTLESTDVLISGFHFYPDDEIPRNANLWQNSLIRAFLNSSSNKTLGKNEDYDLYGEWDFSNRGFLEEAFNLEREPIKEYTIPPQEKVIGEFAFAGCVNLEKINIPSRVTSIDSTAFIDCPFAFAYINRNTRDLVLAKELPKDLSDCMHVVNLSFIKEHINITDYNMLLNSANLRKFGKLADVLYKNKMKIKDSTAMALIDNIYFDTFIKNSDFRFFKNELKDSISYSQKDPFEHIETGFYKFAVLLGCFSNQKMKDKSGKDSEVIVGQKASTLLAQIINKGLLKIEDFDELVKDIPLAFEPNQDFLKFISQQGEKGKLVNLEMILTLEHGYPGLFVKTMTQFDKLKKYRTTLGPTGTPINVPWDDALIKFYKENAYYGVTEDNLDMAEEFSVHGLDQEFFMEAVDLRKKAIEKNVPEHILHEELREETVLESIEKIKARTDLELQDSRELIDDLYAKQFTFEMLSKYDPKNAIMGIYTSCCGTITSDYYGSDIARASILAPDVQNLVVKNYNGEIVAKGTLYVNRQAGYVVINDFELSSVYKQHEIGVGYYDVKRDSSDEKNRDLIFNAFMRGIHAFVAKYDEQNPENPINYVTVGIAHNRLQEQCLDYKLTTKCLTVPTDYKFCDAQDQQRILYDRKKDMIALHSNTSIR